MVYTLPGRFIPLVSIISISKPHSWKQCHKEGTGNPNRALDTVRLCNIPVSPMNIKVHAESFKQE